MGVQWAGEHYLLQKRDEKTLFVAALARHGHRAQDFRVTALRAMPNGLSNKSGGYNVFVDLMRNGQPAIGAILEGGEGKEWVERFEEIAAERFPLPQAAPASTEAPTRKESAAIDAVFPRSRR